MAGPRHQKAGPPPQQHCVSGGPNANLAHESLGASSYEDRRPAIFNL